MKIGFIGFGKVARNLVRLINSENITFLTSAQNRSENTIKNMEESDVEILDTFKEVATLSDILISANSPNQALDVAVKYGKYSKGIYMDLNNISPKETLEINKHVNNFVDGAIIGKIDSANPILYLSGKNLESLAKNLNLEEEFFDILSLTEGEDFKKSALSRINNTKNSKKRKAEELEQIIDYFENQDLTMVKASFKKLNR